MENFVLKIIKTNFLFFIITLILLLVAFFVFAYSPYYTHPDLTGEIAKLWNLKNENQDLEISQKEINWMRDGAINEDEAPRWINHFYDPIYKTGWSGKHFGILTQEQGLYEGESIAPKPAIASIDWVTNQEYQSAYGRQYGNQTWQKAIQSYIDGDKKSAFIALGHILHLIEDASVPDHTRNDTHADLYGDSGSPYEKYSKEYTNFNELNIAENLKSKELLNFSTIQSAFEYLANYSNNNFFSEDTISNEEYAKPNLKTLQRNNNYFYNEVNKIYLAKIYKQVYKEVYTLNNESMVLPSYFNNLAPQAVLTGSSVLNLFFQEVEKYKNNPELLPEIIPDSSEVILSYLQKSPRLALVNISDTYDKASTNSQIFFAQISNFFSGMLDNNDFQPVGRIDLDQAENQSQDAKNQSFETQNQQNQFNKTNQTSQLITALKNQPSKINAQQTNQTQEEEDQEVTQKIQENQKSDDNQTQKNQIQIQQNQQNSPVAVVKQCSFNISQSPSRQKIIINEVAWMGGSGDFGLTAADEWIELKNISGSEISLSGWQILDKSENIKIVFDSGTKISANGFYLLERTDDGSAPGVAVDKIYSGTLNNSDEGLRLFDDQCNLVDEALASSDGSAGSPQGWPAGDNAQKRTMERSPDFSWHNYNGIVQNGILGTPKKENSSPTIVSSGGGSGGNDGGGGTSTDNQQQAVNSTSPPVKILINEVQIYPTENRFIELYNPNNFSVNLTDWYIQRKTQTGGSFGSLVSKTYFESKTINANGYFLISRGSLDGADIILDNLTLTDGNTVQIKNQNGDIIDKVGWGQASECENNCAPQPPESQSIQRKIGSESVGGFVDTDNNAGDFEIQNCPSPKAQSQTCQSAESNLKETLSVSFNNILISEIQIAGDKADDEFIEIYNPTDNVISLAGYSIQYLSGTATSTDKISKKNFSNDSEVAAKSFYLLVNSGATSSLKNKADMTYSAFSLSGNSSGATIFLVGTTTAVSDINDPAIIDSLSYGNSQLVVSAAVLTAPDSGQSLERKAFSGGVCVSSQNENEFLGNGCDTDNATDFEIRGVSNPQNSQNFPEPRNAPTAPENFIIEYSSSAMELNFNWSASLDYGGASSTIVYKIIDAGVSSTFPVIETILTTSTIPLDENNFGKNYLFSIRAFDKEGLGSEFSQKEILIPNSMMIVAQQLDKSISAQGTGNGEFSQRLGNGLLGSPDSVTFHARFPSTPTHASAFDIRAEFWESDSDSYNNLKRVSYNHCQPTHYWSAAIDRDCPNLNFEFDVDKDYTIPVLEKFVFDPNKYYKVRFVTYQSQADFYGSASDDSYAYGYAAIEKGNVTAPPQLSEVKDLYFVINSKPPIELPIGISFSLPQNFEISYTPEEPFLFFNWRQPRYFENASSVLTYKISDVSDNGPAIADIETSDFNATTLINEVGRRYKFAAWVFDESGQESDPAQKEIIVPHHLTGLYIITSQLGGEISAQGTGNGEFFQTLGGGLNGKLGAVTFRAKFASAPQSIRANFYEADNADFVGAEYVESAAYCGVGADSICDNQIIELGVGKKYTIPAVKNYVFNPAKYYKFEIITYQSEPDFYGSESDVYQNGAVGAPHGTGAIKDLYFIISSRIPLIVSEGL